MTNFILDASALGKRYVDEPGSDLVDRLFDEVGGERLLCITMGALEPFAIVIRARNKGTLTAQEASDAEALLQSELVDGAVEKIHPPASAVFAATALIAEHKINSTDAVLLLIALGLRDALAQDGNSLVLVAADRRLLRAATAESLTTFDPENDDLARLQSLAAA